MRVWPYDQCHAGALVLYLLYRSAIVRRSPMTGLPTGTVTLLFADLASSPQGWEEDSQPLPAALASYAGVVRLAVAAHGGTIFRTAGATLCAAFSTAPQALAAALAARRTLETGPSARHAVRMALHTGTAELFADDYIGLLPSRTARLLAASHGGQVLLSRVTQELVRDHPPPDVTLRDLGEHRLTDLTRPEQIFQLVAPDLPADFPPLRTLDTHPTNLPAQPTPLVGREHEVTTACAILRQPTTRLLTLTGPGGTGKTRLALQVAAELLDHFADGVYFVALAPIGDSSLVLPTIAATLGVKEAGDQTLFDTLASYLRNKQMLLLLDNFEHLVDAAPLVVALLAATQDLNVLVTSRAVLHLSGEHEFAVPPLALPPTTDHRPLTTDDAGGQGVGGRSSVVGQYAAVRLLIARAQAVKPDFAITNDNAPAVAEICYRLDGLPLAIELAAARLKLFSPQALLGRLERRLPLLTGGPRDLPARQQTLRSTIDWSYHLLDPEEQTLFRRLGVCVGGCTQEAAEAVCAGAGSWDAGESAGSLTVNSQLPTPVLDGLEALIDKSLLRAEYADDEARFMMLETIREYALEQLAAHREAEAMRRCHAAFFLALAEEAEPRLTTGEQRTWLDCLDREHDNLRAALTWSLQDKQTGRQADRETSRPGLSRSMPSLLLVSLPRQELGLRLAAALWWFWWVRGYLSEGRAWLERAISDLPKDTQFAILDLNETDRFNIQHPTSNIALRATALYRAAFLAQSQGDYAGAAALGEESLALFHSLGDSRGIAWAHYVLGMIVLMQGGYAGAVAHYEASLALFRDAGDTRGLAWTLNDLASVAVLRDDYAGAAARFEESLALFRSLGDTRDIASCLNNLGEVAKAQDDYAGAAARFEESLALFRSLDDLPGISMALQGLGYVTQAQGDYAQAKTLLEASLNLYQKAGSKYGIALCLTGLATVAAAEGQPVRAARLFGAAEAQHDQIGAFLVLAERVTYDRSRAALRARLDAATFAVAWAEGHAMTPEQAVAVAEPARAPDAISPLAAPSAPGATPPTYPAGLTEREVDVLRLLAQGLSYAQIAETLVISPRTVNRHLTSIYSKLDVTSRHAAARFAIDHHLV
jgi:predicted ATPase/class 3 adenylate cyclase/DNA-binding NarL/FixJ family response regulator